MIDFTDFVPVASAQTITPSQPEAKVSFDEWLTSLEQTESSGGRNLFNKRTGATGPLQVTPIAVREVGGDYQRALEDHAYARGLGVKYARKLWNEFEGNPYLTAAAYHTGPTKIRQLMRQAKEAGKDPVQFVVSQLGPEGRGHNEKTVGRFSGVAAPRSSGLRSFDEFGPTEQPAQEKPSKVFEFLKGVGGEVASLADVVWGLGTMPLSVGAQLSSTAIGLATGESPTTAYQSGRKAGHKVNEWIGNPAQKIMSMLESGEIYEKAKTTQGMAWLTEQIENADRYWHEKSDGKVPLGSFAMLTETAMVGMMGKGAPDAVRSGVDALRRRLRERTGRPEPRTFEDFTQRDIERNPDGFIESVLKEEKEKEQRQAKLQKFGMAAKVGAGAAAGAGGLYLYNKLRGQPEEKQVEPQPDPDGIYTADITDLNQIGPAVLGITAFGMRPRFERGLSLANRVEAVKESGGMWHPEAVERLAESVRRGNWYDTTPYARPIGHVEGPEALAKVQAEVDAKNAVRTLAKEWPDRAIRNYLNKYAGTTRDPLKDVEIPSGEGTKRWENAWEQAIRPVLGENVPGGRRGEVAYGLDAGWTNTNPGVVDIKSYLSHVGDYLRQNVPPEKLAQYDLVRAVKETAANDARVAKEMAKAAQATTKSLPVYKEYSDGFRWVELKKPERLTEEQAKGVKRIEVDQAEVAPNKYYAVGPDGKAIMNSYTGEPARGRTPEEAWLAGRLAEEGNQMGHCVGGYCGPVASGESRIYSLRGPDGKSHVTVEVAPQRSKNKGYGAKDPLYVDDIVQIKGKQNRAPVAEYLPYVQDFVRSGKWGEVGDLQNTGLIRGRDVNNWHAPWGQVYNREQLGLKPDQFYTAEELGKIGREKFEPKGHTSVFRIISPSDIHTLVPSPGKEFIYHGGTSSEISKIKVEGFKERTPRDTIIQALIDVGVDNPSTGLLRSILDYWRGTKTRKPWPTFFTKDVNYILEHLGDASFTSAYESRNNALWSIEGYFNDVGNQIVADKAKALQQQILAEPKQIIAIEVPKGRFPDTGDITFTKEEANKLLGKGPASQQGFTNLELQKMLAITGIGAVVGATLSDADRRAWGAMLGGGLAAAVAAFGRGAKGRGPLQSLDYGLGVISTRLRNISEPLRFRAVDYERRVLRDIHEAFTQVQPFLKALSKVPKDKIVELNRAIISNDSAAINKAIAGIGDPKLSKGWQDTRQLLNAMGERWQRQGRIKKMLDEYFPRIVKNVDGLMQALGKELAPDMQQALQEANLTAIKTRGTELSQLEQSIIIGNMLQNWRRNPGQLSHAKARRLREVTNEIVQFYATPTEALHSYISTVVRDLEKARFFGKDLAEKVKNGQTYLDLDTSISNVVRRELDEGRINQEQAAELQSIIKSRFTTGEQGASPWVQDARNMANMGLLGNFVAAVTQFGDAAIATYLQGLRPTLASLARNLTGTTRITAKDLGLIDHIAEEFASTRRSARALNNLFKLSGFAKVDSFGKNVVLNAALSRFERMATTMVGRAELAKKYGEALGPEFPQLISDLQAKRVSDPVKATLFAELSDAQPITRMEVPQGYLDHPNGRILYMLKTFMIKQLDIARRDGYNEIKKGNVAKGLKNLAAYGTVLGIAGATTDQVKNWLMGKDDPLEARDVYLNILKTFGLSQYMIDKANKEGVAKAIWSTVIMPPFAMFEEIAKADPKAWRYVPIIGPLVQSRIMEGGQRSTDAKQKQDMMRLVDPETQLQHKRLQEGREQLYRQYQRGDVEGFDKGLKELREQHKLTEKQVNAIRKNAKLPADIRKFKSLPLEQQRDILQNATPEQRDRLRKYANKRLREG